MKNSRCPVHHLTHTVLIVIQSDISEIFRILTGISNTLYTGALSGCPLCLTCVRFGRVEEVKRPMSSCF